MDRGTFHLRIEFSKPFMKGIKLQHLPLFHRKYRRHRHQLKANDKIVVQGSKNIAHRQTEVHSETDMKRAAKTRFDGQLSPSDSHSSNSISEEPVDEEQQYQVSSENTAIGASDSALVDDNSNLPTHTPTARSMKSLQVIFPSTSQTKYEDMFLLEKIAFIYIELVVKRGHKSMTNWPFRHLAR